MITKARVLEAYDEVVGGYAAYQRMIRSIARQVNDRVLEVGAGTGLLTEQLLKNNTITKLTVIELDRAFIRKFRKKLPNVPVLMRSGLSFRSRQRFDFIVMSLVYHHIPDRFKIKFLRNIRKNLTQNGALIIGDVFIPPYRNEHEHNISLKAFHHERIARAKDAISKMVERQALRDGLRKKGEYKTSLAILLRQLRTVGFCDIAVARIGPQITGGYALIKARR